MRRIVETAHREVTELLRAHRANLDALVNALLERETLDEVDAYAAAGLTRTYASDGAGARNRRGRSGSLIHNGWRPAKPASVRCQKPISSSSTSQHR